MNSYGSIESLQIIGHNYLKDTVAEILKVEGGSVSWNSTSENGSSDYDPNSYFVGVNSGFGSTELLVRKMLKSEDQSTKLYPSGEAKITDVESHIIGDSIELRLIEFIGFSFSPNYVWFDSNNRFFAAPSTWLSCIRAGFETINETLLEIQTDKQKAYYADLANKLTSEPSGNILIKNVNVFDANSGTVVDSKDVLINGDKIEAITDSGTTEYEFNTMYDGTGKTLLPGLFDNHVHIGRPQGILHLAAGVTSVRDLANSFDVPEIRDEFNANSVLGPRVLIMSGFIDQAGPYAGPIGKIINNLDEGLEAIDFYHEREYQQIKLYSSIDPAWVEPLAEKTHERGLKLSGHIPAYMTATQAVDAGYDEIQHVNMLALNFMSDTIDTRTPLRFSMIGEHAHNIDLQGIEFNNFIQLLKDENIILDPTVSIFEGMLTAKAGEPDPQFAEILDRLPIQVKRGFFSGGLPIPEGKEQIFKDSFQKLLDIVKAAYDAGITIIPGTDAMAGFALHKELENYVRAGIPAGQVLKMATLTSARVCGYEADLGSIEVGKLADIILVDGNPVDNISTIRRVEWTMKDGKIYTSKDLYEAIGVQHFE